MGGAVEDGVDHAAQVGVGSVAQEGDGRLGRTGQLPARAAREPARQVGAHALDRELDAFEARGIEPHRVGRMVVAQQQIAAAFHQHGHHVMHVARDQPGGDLAELGLEPPQPGREEGEGERVRDGEHERVARGRLVAAHQRARRMQAVDEIRRRSLEGLARFGEPGREGAAVDQRHPQPGLERADPAREGGLRDVALLGRAREAPAVGEAEEIFQPFEFHGRALQGERPHCMQEIRRRSPRTAARRPSPIGPGARRAGAGRARPTCPGMHAGFAGPIMGRFVNWFA